MKQYVHRYEAGKICMYVTDAFIYKCSCRYKYINSLYKNDIQIACKYLQVLSRKCPGNKIGYGIKQKLNCIICANKGIEK